MSISTDTITTDTGTTDTGTTGTITIDAGTSGIADPRPLLAAATSLAIDVVDAVRPDQLHLPTPCGAFDVEQLLGHLLFALDRVATVGRGDELGESDELVTSTDWSADLRARADAIASAWAADHRLTDVVTLPWTSITGAEALGVYISEVTVHTWDLATSIGVTPEWDDAVCEVALAAMHRELPVVDRDPIWAGFLEGAPADVEFSPPFANATEVADDAPAIDRLVAWTGRVA